MHWDTRHGALFGVAADLFVMVTHRLWINVPDEDCGDTGSEFFRCRCVETSVFLSRVTDQDERQIGERVHQSASLFELAIVSLLDEFVVVNSKIA